MLARQAEALQAKVSAVAIEADQRARYYEQQVELERLRGMRTSEKSRTPGFDVFVGLPFYSVRIIFSRG